MVSATDRDTVHVCPWGICFRLRLYITNFRTHHLKRLVDLVNKGLELETHNDVPVEIR